MRNSEQWVGVAAFAVDHLDDPREGVRTCGPWGPKGVDRVRRLRRVELGSAGHEGGANLANSHLGEARHHRHHVLQHGSRRSASASSLASGTGSLTGVLADQPAGLPAWSFRCPWSTCQQPSPCPLPLRRATSGVRGSADVADTQHQHLPCCAISLASSVLQKFRHANTIPDIQRLFFFMI